MDEFLLPHEVGRREKRFHTCAVEAEDLWDACGKYYEGPEYGTAGLYPGCRSQPELASVPAWPHLLLSWAR